MNETFSIIVQKLTAKTIGIAIIWINLTKIINIE